MASHKAGWRNEKHAYQRLATLSTYAYPIIGALPVSAVDTAIVLKVLEPIWVKKIRDREPGPPAHRKHLGLSKGTWLSRRQKPRALVGVDH